MGLRTFCVIFRRTADVRTIGYVECFVLSKEDVLSAIRDYPEAQVTRDRNIKGFVNHLCHDCHIDIDRDVSTAYCRFHPAIVSIY